MTAARVPAAAPQYPVIATFSGTAQDIQFVVTQYAASDTGLHQFDDPLHHRGAVGAPVHQVPGEHQLPALRVAARLRVTQHAQQGLQRLVLAVDIADDIGGAVGEVLD